MVNLAAQNKANQKIYTHPLEETVEQEIGKVSLTIGLPKETDETECRVALTPMAVDLLVRNGHKVFVEKDAGIKSNYHDNSYAEVGASIKDKHEDIFKADIIVKVAPLTSKEIKLLRENQTVFSSVNVGTTDIQTFKKLIDKKINAVGYEFIRDNAGFYPVVHSINEISGFAAINVATELLSVTSGGKGVLLGGITGISPTEIIIFGTGVAARHAAKAAFALGATVKIFDFDVNNLRIFKELTGIEAYTSVMYPDIIEKALKTADVVISAFEADFVLPCFITREMIASMKKGSVIVDLNIDSGSCFETAKPTNHKNPIFTEVGVIHYCVPNISSKYARTSSIALSNVITPLILEMGNNGGLMHYIRTNLLLRNGVYLFNGILTNKTIALKFGLDYTDIDLFMSIF